MAKKQKYTGVMIDCETLGTTADAVIMSIGAVKFDLNSGAIDDKAFYSSISIDSNHEAAPRHISEDTIVWWMKQSEEARKVFSEQKTTLYCALQDLSDWFDHDDYEVWSNGADFDIPMLAHAFHTNGLKAPWKFWNTRCFRTYKSLAQVRNVPKPANAVAHNALSDALAQTGHLIAMHNAMKVVA